MSKNHKFSPFKDLVNRSESLHFDSKKKRHNDLGKESKAE